MTITELAVKVLELLNTSELDHNSKVAALDSAKTLLNSQGEIGELRSTPRPKG